MTKATVWGMLFLFLGLVNLSGIRAEQVICVGHASPTEETSFSAISHQSWSELLSRYVDEKGGVDYGSWFDSPTDRTKLSNYLDHLSTLNLESVSSQSEQLAFWINAYNALTIHAVLHHYPMKSIRDIANEDGGFNVWDDYRIHIGQKTFSLNQIEHDVLRKLGDPRIHFAIVCASKSCPALGREAYSSEQIEHQLTRDAKRFFAQPSNFVDDQGTIQTSAILQWFGEDFGGSDAETLQRISPWLRPQDRTAVRPESSQLDFQPYDWSLNESRNKETNQR